MNNESVSHLIAVVFVTCSVGWFLFSHTTLSAVVLLTAGVLCLVWLLARPTQVQRAALTALLILAAGALLACMVWAGIELARHV